MQVDGPKAGKLVYVDLGESVAESRNGRTPRPRDADGNVVPMSLAERRARLQKRRDAFVVKHVKDFLDKLTPERATEIVSPWVQRRNNRRAGATVFDPAALLTAFGSTKRADYVDEGQAWKEYDSLRDAGPIQQAAAALLSVVQVWIRRLNIQSSHNAGAQAEDARRMCQILGLDFATIETEAVKAIPEPKSWADLRDDDASADQPGNDSSDRADSPAGTSCGETVDSDPPDAASAELPDDSDPPDAASAESTGESDGDYADWPATREPHRGRGEAKRVAEAV